MKDEKKKVVVSLSLQDYKDLSDFATAYCYFAGIPLNQRMSRLLVCIVKNAIRENRRNISIYRLFIHQYRKGHRYSYDKIREAFELIRSLEAQNDIQEN